MGENANIVVKLLLLPLSLIYGFVMAFRNFLFDINILRSKEFHIPVISVGNITVGGTGKTPHIEYLIELLSKDYKIAVLSRGYKRKTRKFIIATENTPVGFIGDEPWQMKEKYPEVTVAVDSNRVRGINNLLKEIPDIDVILLDDAFQHRYVSPGISILLVDYYRPITKDHMMPLGWLRESASQRKRADLIIYSKSPAQITPIDKRIMVSNLKITANQHAYFTTVTYQEPAPLVSESSEITFQDIKNEEYSILLVAGIANPNSLISELGKYSKNIKPLLFQDHHYFSKDDLKKIQDAYEALPGENKIIITTEKDAARLKEFASILVGANHWYYVPIKIEFHPGEAENFSKYIFHYVTNNNRNSILYKKQSRI
jgi:tetraacyldisaccharide 4'-kinase